MQQKKEVRVLLAESFKELVLEKPIEKITIKEITDRAGVIRVTFYNHFQDKYELLEWICREDVVTPIRVLLWNGMEKEGLIFLFSNILRNKAFYMHAVRLEGQNSFESTMRKCFQETVTEYLQEHVPQIESKYPWLTPARAGEFYSMGLSYMLIAWIKSGMGETPERMVEMYAFMSRYSMANLPVKM